MLSLPLDRRLLAGALLVLGAALAQPAIADETVWNWSFGPVVNGSGKLQTENRAVGSFQAIALRSSMKLVLHQGGRESLELRADDNVLPLIESRIVDRDGVPTLELGLKKGTSYKSGTPIVAHIELISLRALSISGSGDVVGDALKTPALAIAISGSGNVKLGQLAADEVSAKVSGSGDLLFGGKAGKLAVSISGSGDVNARSLEADDVSISMAGSGDASVTARKTLNVSIAGSGSVVYAGDPIVKSSIAGHGSVRKQ